MSFKNDFEAHIFNHQYTPEVKNIPHKLSSLLHLVLENLKSTQPFFELKNKR